MLKRKSILRRGVALLCVMWLLWGLSVTVFAADEPDTSRTGSITVTLKNGSISAADGVPTCYEVAALTDGAYVYAEDFSAYTVSRPPLRCRTG
ncbi:MAG: hypothetical protein LUD54_02215 [Oscillospiraceae bacterium]|nr:hypothetical protein [Oscillospiraceae bacterium]